MSKREKIIIAVMLATVLIGGYMYFYTSEGGGGPIQPEDHARDLDQFVMQVVNDLTNTDRTSLDGFILAKALGPWSLNPFAQPKAKTAADSPGNPPAAFSVPVEPAFSAPPMIYSGYLRIGNRHLAIINGEGYAVGETIEPEGAVLVSILPMAAEVLFAEANMKITLPLQQPQ